MSAYSRACSLRRWAAAAWAILCLISGPSDAGQPHTLARVERRDVRIVLRVKGLPQTTASQAVLSPITAIVKEVLCAPGQPVQEGQVLVTFQDPQPTSSPLRQTWVPEVRAAFSGQVQAVPVSVGDVVFGEGECSPPTALVTVSQGAATSLRLPLLPCDVKKVQPGMPARLRLSDGTERISAVSAVSEQDLTMEFCAEPGTAWRTDLGIEAELELARQKSALTIPVEAIQVTEGKPFATQVQRFGRDVRIELKIGICDGQRVVIEQGLAEGDWVRIKR